MDTCYNLDEFKGQAGGDRCVGVGLKKKWICWYVNNEFELDAHNAHNGDVKRTWASVGGTGYENWYTSGSVKCGSY